MQLNDKKFLNTFSISLLVIFGVMVKNGGSQYYQNRGQPLPDSVFYTGMLFFVFGWIAVAYMLRRKNKKQSLLSVGSSMGILLSVGVMMMAKRKNGGIMPRYAKKFVLVFIASWLVLGYSIGLYKSKLAMNLGLAGALSVILSMIITLPWQRKNKVIDGPGMGLFVLGWVLVSAGNSV